MLDLNSFLSYATPNFFETGIDGGYASFHENLLLLWKIYTNRLDCCAENWKFKSSFHTVLRKHMSTEACGELRKICWQVQHVSKNEFHDLDARWRQNILSVAVIPKHTILLALFDSIGRKFPFCKKNLIILEIFTQFTRSWTTPLPGGDQFRYFAHKSTQSLILNIDISRTRVSRTATSASWPGVLNHFEDNYLRVGI